MIYLIKRPPSETSVLFYFSWGMYSRPIKGILSDIFFRWVFREIDAVRALRLFQLQHLSIDTKVVHRTITNAAADDGHV